MTDRSRRMDLVARAALIVAVLAAFALRLWRLGDAPFGFHPDEGHNALDALAIADGWRPAFLPGNNGREPMFMYLMAGLLSVAGPSIWAARLAGAFAGTLVVPAVYALVRALPGPGHDGPRWWRHAWQRRSSGRSPRAATPCGPGSSRCGRPWSCGPGGDWSPDGGRTSDGTHPTARDPHQTTRDPHPTAGDPQRTAGGPHPTAGDPHRTAATPHPTARDPQTTRDPHPTAGDPQRHAHLGVRRATAGGESSWWRSAWPAPCTRT